MSEFCKYCIKDFPTSRGVFIHESKCFFRPDNYRGGQKK